MFAKILRSNVQSFGSARQRKMDGFVNAIQDSSIQISSTLKKKMKNEIKTGEKEKKNKSVAFSMQRSTDVQLTICRQHQHEMFRLVPCLKQQCIQCISHMNSVCLTRTTA